MRAAVSGTRQGNSCGDAPSGQVLLAIRQFNGQQWYECHETLEPLWMQADGECRALYQGIIQLAIAQHHWRNGNFNGALALLQSATEYLTRVPATCLWIDVAALSRQAAILHRTLAERGAAAMHSLDRTLLLQITTVSV